MGGLGKTTLARLVYNDQKVMNHFNIRMWICASNEFDDIRLTKDMIDAAYASKGHKEEYHITNWDLMQRKLCEEIQEKTFLLVLDDVWEGSRTQWEKLFEPLKLANKESKILVTSRNIDAVNNIGQRRMHPVILRGLSDDDLWLFFERCAFDGYNLEEYIHLQGIGRQIAHRLKGLPLAAKTIGYLLNTKLDFNYWKKIMKNEMWELQQQNEDDILPTLGLSYQYLPGYLKQCFSYCSLFPKNYLFYKRSLVRLWNAECFNRTERNIEMEDISSEDFDDLLHRSFFEPAPYRRDWYVMHDLMHDLAEYISKDDCFRLEDNKRSVKNFDTVRHMSLNVKKFNLVELNKFCRPEKLRTFLFLQGCEVDDLIFTLDELFLKLKRLRVLNLSRCGIKELPSSIGHLKHLRYIDLSYNKDLEYLPDSLCDLYNLQVLGLEGCGSLRALPTRTSELSNLRNLIENTGWLVSKIDGLSKLTGLQEIQVRGGKVRELGGMSVLRKIKIDFVEEVGTEEEATQARLHSKEHLQELQLRSRTGRDASSIDRKVEEEILHALRPADSMEFLKISGYGGAKSPDWMIDRSVWTCFCLKTVVLVECPNWEVLPSMGQLRCLISLEIRGMASVRRLDLRFFPLLEKLDIVSLPEWEEWGGPSRDGDHHPQQNQNPSAPQFLPRLRSLVIKSCPRLMELPPLPPTLTELSLGEVGLTCLPGLSECGGGGGDVSCSSSASAGLSNLRIEKLPNLTSVGGLLGHPLTALEKLTIGDCENLVDLPEKGFGHLVSLKDLKIFKCPRLSCPPLTRDEEDEDAPSQHLPSSLEKLHIFSCGDAIGGWWWAGLQRLTSLASLTLSRCPTTAAALFVRLARHRHHHLAETLTKLWIKKCGYDYQQQSMPCTSISLPPPPAPPNPPEHATAGVFQSLKSLQEFSIVYSPNLLRKWGGSGLLSSLQRLYVNGDDGLNEECLSTCLQHLTSLQSLSIFGCPAITSLPAGAVEDHHHRAPLLHSQVMTMTALQNLYIEDCQELASLGHFPALPSLKKLSIKNCPKLNLLQISSASSSIEELKIIDSSPQQMRGWLLNSNLVFQNLHIKSCPLLTSFDEEGGGKELEEALLHQAPSLRLLTIDFCGNLRSLPAELSSLSSLETLQISYCPQIQSLPEMGLPSSLRTLNIEGCPALKERCRDQDGPKWPKISRIPEVHVKVGMFI